MAATTSGQTPHSDSTVIIIGAGIGGLSTGCYAQMNGFRSKIFEAHTIPGGLCTSWRREGYLFDGAVRYLVGTGSHTRTYPMWRELGVLPGRGIHHYDEFICYEGQDGRVVHFYTDPDKLEAHLLTLSPQDRDLIYKFAQALREMGDFDLPLDLSPDDAAEGLAFGRVMLGHAFPLIGWMNLTVRDFARHFKDPLLREAFPNFFQCTPDDFPMLMLLMTLAPMSTQASGYPLGGSLALAEAMAHRYTALGGEIEYGAHVVKILVEHDCAVGVQLADGTEHRADIVISNADGYNTIFKLLDGRYVNDTIRTHYDTLPVSESIVQISIGVRRDFTSVPPMLDFPLDQPIDMGGRLHHRLVLKHYAFDPIMARPGHASLSVWAEASYDYWTQLHQDTAAYEAKKHQLGQAVVAALDRRFPGLASDVDVVDVATPVTYERYTANHRGSIHGWALGMKKMQFMMRMGMPKTLPGLTHFYRVGHWVEPAGNIQLAAASGRDLIEMICRKQGRAFVTTEAPGPNQ